MYLTTPIYTMRKNSTIWHQSSYWEPKNLFHQNFNAHEQFLWKERRKSFSFLPLQPFHPLSKFFKNEKYHCAHFCHYSNYKHIIGVTDDSVKKKTCKFTPKKSRRKKIQKQTTSTSLDDHNWNRNFYFIFFFFRRNIFWIKF